MIDFALLAAAGLLAGYVNALAGAGSLLTLPALIFTGLDAPSANATNRIAVLIQTFAATVTFHRSGFRPGRTGWLLCLPTVPAAALGAWVASRMSDRDLRLLIAGAMVTFLALSFVRRSRGESQRTHPPTLTPALALAFAGIGFYAGLLQAGVGILILLTLSLGARADLLWSNGVKILVVCVLTVAALGVFALSPVRIDIPRGLVLAMGSVVGSVLGAKHAIKRGEGLIRAAMILAVVASVVKLAWDAFQAS
ncbi:MAG: sulfite exporter TauE/SafE family protein [Myxococcales bacterium]|nr:sulfite exporter TauE/SafE family protein [Myxococcales bacterium]